MTSVSAGDAGQRLQERLTEFTNLCLAGRIPAVSQPVFCGAALCALNTGTPTSMQLRPFKLIDFESLLYCMLCTTISIFCVYSHRENCFYVLIQLLAVKVNKRFIIYVLFLCRDLGVNSRSFA